MVYKWILPLANPPSIECFFITKSVIAEEVANQSSTDWIIKSKTVYANKTICVLFLLAAKATDDSIEDPDKAICKILFLVFREHSIIVNLSINVICDMFCQKGNLSILNFYKYHPYILVLSSIVCYLYVSTNQSVLLCHMMF